MGLLDNIGKTISEVGHSTLKIGVDAANAAKYNLSITEEEHKLEKSYCELGRKYSELYNENYDPEFAEIMLSIAESKCRIDEWQKLMKEIKGITKCDNCGCDIPAGVYYCPNCGNKVKEENETEPVEKKPDKITCPKCKTVLKAGTNYCTKCGTPLDGSYVPESEEPIEVVEPEDKINIPEPDFSWDINSADQEERSKE